MCQETTNAPHSGAFLPLLFKLAGDEPAVWHTLFEDFIIVAHKLELLGFTYFKGKVIIVASQE